MRYIYSLGLMSMVVVLGLNTVSPAQAKEQLPDGSFEDLDSTWQCTDNCTLNIFDYFLASANAVEGIWYAYIFHDAEIYQDFSIPSDTSSISFWFDNQSDDEVPEEGSFSLTLIDSTTGETYATEIFDEQADDWIEGSFTIPAAARGQNVRFTVSNLGGFNRLDFFEFMTADDELNKLIESFATVRLRVFSAKGKAVKDAVIYIKQNGQKLDLINLKTGETVRKVTSNKKGRTPKFLISQNLDEGESVKVCVKKNKVTECAAISPSTGVQTDYQFTFESNKVK